MAPVHERGPREPSVLAVHNFYQQPGGEDEVFRAESRLLAAHGHEVVAYTASNKTIGPAPRVSLARATLWNGGSYRELRTLCRSAGHSSHISTTPFL